VKFVKWLSLSALVLSGVSAAVPTVSSAAEDDVPKCGAPGVSGSVLAAPTEANVDHIVELNKGEDPAHWAAFILDAVGVSAEDQSARYIYTYHCALNGLWLRLTPAESEQVDAMMGARPSWAKAAGAAYQVTAPIVADSVVDYTNVSPQVTPSWLERLDWKLPTGGNMRFVNVAVLDTGVDVFHDDLDDSIVEGYDCTHNYADRWQYDFHGHGTHVAGTIAAENNDVHVVGGAVGVKIIPIPVLGADGSGSSASVLCGADQAMLRGAQFANLSLGGGALPSACGGLDPSHNGFCAATKAGVVFVVAAGNDANDAYYQAPANYEEVVTVAAIADYAGGVPVPGCSVDTPNNTAATFTSYGTIVDVATPGVCTLSTIPGNATAWASGTSMATPAAVAVLAEYEARCSEYRHDRPGQLRDVVQEVIDGSADWDAAEYIWTFGPDRPPLIKFQVPCAGGLS
jgi:hypothetical protein